MAKGATLKNLGRIVYPQTVSDVVLYGKTTVRPTLDTIFENLNNLQNQIFQNDRFKGYYNSLDELIKNVPNPVPGDYALIKYENSPDEFYIWDDSDKSWIAKGTVLKSAVTSVNGQIGDARLDGSNIPVIVNGKQSYLNGELNDLFLAKLEIDKLDADYINDSLEVFRLLGPEDVYIKDLSEGVYVIPLSPNSKKIVYSFENGNDVFYTIENNGSAIIIVEESSTKKTFTLFESSGGIYKGETFTDNVGNIIKIIDAQGYLYSYGKLVATADDLIRYATLDYLNENFVKNNDENYLYAKGENERSKDNNYTVHIKELQRDYYDIHEMDRKFEELPNVDEKISEHNESPNAHLDIRQSIKTRLSELIEDENHRTVTDEEKTKWNAKSDFSGNYEDLQNAPNNLVYTDTEQVIDGLKTFSEGLKTNNIDSREESDLKINFGKSTGLQVGESGQFKVDSKGNISTSGSIKKNDIEVATIDDIPTNISQLNNDANYIDKEVNNLTNYTLSTGVGSLLDLSIDNSTYVMTLSLKNSNGDVLSADNIDLPLESVFVDASYNNGVLTITLQNGNTVDIDISDIVKGLVPDTRKVNGYDLTKDINLTTGDVGALPVDGTAVALKDFSNNQTVSSADDAINNGFYHISPGDAKNPFKTDLANADYRILTTAYDSSNLQQIATDYRENDMYYRIKNNDNWTDWIKIANIDDIPNTSNPVLTGTTDNPVLIYDLLPGSYIIESESVVCLSSDNQQLTVTSSGDITINKSNFYPKMSPTLGYLTDYYNIRGLITIGTTTLGLSFDSSENIYMICKIKTSDNEKVTETNKEYVDAQISTVNEALEGKLENSNIIAGNNIEITTNGNDVTIGTKNLVVDTRKINGYDLSQDRNLTYEDVGALSGDTFIPIVDTELNAISTNAIENKVVTKALEDKADITDIPTDLSQLNEDTTHRLVTDEEKSTWNAKSDFSGSYNDLNDQPVIPTIKINGSQTTEADFYAAKTGGQAGQYLMSNGANNNPTWQNIFIPSKTSDITNDSGFITNAANNLANYYLKNQTYTKEEVNVLLTAIPKFAIEVVSELPTENISSTAIYFLKTGDENSNVYTEYIYVNSVWEELGTQEVDLTNYPQRSELSSVAFSGNYDDLINKPFLPANMVSFKDEVDTTSDLNTLENYYNISQVNDLISTRSATSHNHNDLYYTKEETDKKTSNLSKIELLWNGDKNINSDTSVSLSKEVSSSDLILVIGDGFSINFVGETSTQIKIIKATDTTKIEEEITKLNLQVDGSSLIFSEMNTILIEILNISEGGFNLTSTNSGINIKSIYRMTQ